MIRALIRLPFVLLGAVSDELRAQRRIACDRLESEPGMREWYASVGEQCRAFLRRRGCDCPDPACKCGRR